MEHDQFKIAELGMEEIARIGMTFQNERSVSTLVAFQDSLRAIRADITAIDLTLLTPVQRRRAETWLSTVDGWTQAVEKLMVRQISVNKS
ncbi:MAG: hypothetical protein AAB612_01255 [Patescibacteria group bacterium]